MQIALISILVGAALLTMGRKLFWLFVAVIGFAFGYNLAGQLAAQYFNGGLQGGVLAFAAVLALSGALLAVFLEKVAVGAAGFLLGGYLTMQLAGRLEAGIDLPVLALFVAGGLVGVLLVAVVFNWALVVLTSLTGALLILSGLPAQPAPAAALFVALVVLGMALQLGLMRHWKRVH